MLEVINAGMYSSIQDLGRFGNRAYAIPQSGCLDSYSFRIANYLAGNSLGESAIEILGGHFSAIALKKCCISVAGADVSINEVAVSSNKTLQLERNDRVTLTKGINGDVAYLAMSGGIVSSQHFRSASTYPLAELGGMKGRSLQKGDVIESKKETHFESRVLPEDVYPKPQSNGVIRILKGPEYSLKGSQHKLAERDWSISSESNRMGVRLSGRLLLLKDKLEMSSVPTFPGTIQLTHQGQPIILLNDAQTTGGYPRIAQVIQADLSRLGQMLLGGIIRFRFVDISEARHILSQKESFLNHALNADR